MAQVLTAVPVAGLDAELVAVELVLDSGVLSAEHVLNVVAYLRSVPVLESAETSLQLNQGSTDRQYRALRQSLEIIDVLAYLKDTR